MGKTEQLPDDFDASLNLNLQNAPFQAETTTSLADMYEKRLNTPEALSSRSFEEIMYDMSKTPLFMNSADVANANEDDSPLKAFQALQYEGTKSEVIQNFKEQGNEMVQQKRWKDAKEFYAKAVAVLTAKPENDKWDKPENQAEEDAKLKVLHEQIYVNRALCNLELKNYRSTTLDCSITLQTNPLNIKAHYRSATALLALDKIHESLDVCYRGLKISPSNTALQSLLTKIQSRSSALEAADRKRLAQTQRLASEKSMLNTVLTSRNIVLRGTDKPPDLQDAQIRLSPDPLSSTSLLEFPVMLLYPIHNQSDLIKAFAEKDALYQHLSYILPVPWDERGEYSMERVDCYMDTKTGGMMKVGKKMKLGDVLGNGKVEVVDGLVRIYVVPGERARGWIEEVKSHLGK